MSSRVQQTISGSRRRNPVTWRHSHTSLYTPNFRQTTQTRGDIKLRYKDTDMSIGWKILREVRLLWDLSPVSAMVDSMGDESIEQCQFHFDRKVTAQ
jgi:hypothetical protein